MMPGPTRVGNTFNQLRRLGGSAAGPAGLALVVTLLNAGKPPVVDDTAYLLFARHLAHHPFDPYGWQLNWYREPEPAMAVLLPPVLPYWLALGVRVVGEHPTALKLWLFPVLWLLARSVWGLFGRFAAGWQSRGTALVLLGPGVLPLVNVMLDVPALALSLAAVLAFVRGCDRGDGRRVLLAGLLAGLAMQTKYTALTLPAVFACYVVMGSHLTSAPRPSEGVVQSASAPGQFSLRPRWRVGLRSARLASAVAWGVFAGWELALATRYGESHFVHHLGDQTGDLWDKLGRKADLARPLVAQLGGLGAVWGLLAARAAGVTLRWLTIVAGLATAGFLAVATVPAASAVLLRSGRTGTPRLDLPALVFLPLGYAVLVAGGWAAVRVWRTPDGRFLLAWLMVELAGYFALTPFPAARRAVPLLAVLGLVVARASAVGPPRWLVGWGVACGVGLWAVDAWDARAEPRGVELAAGDVSGTVWTQGHWGWQHDADGRGWRLAVSGRDMFAAGDYLVLPVEPDAAGFFRPYHGGAKLLVDPGAVTLVAEHVVDDRLPAQTVPNLYGGVYPLVGRDHPRLRVRVYRVTRPWQPATAGTP